MPLVGLDAAIECLQDGDVLAYPTEAVYGLGCAPNHEQAVRRILTLKARDVSKGLIVVAGDMAQLNEWIDPMRLMTEFPHVLQSWHNPDQAVTWLLPCKPSTPKWLTGQFDTLAVRLSHHPQVKALCEALGHGIVSTSANPSGKPAAESSTEVATYFPSLAILDGDTLQFKQPSSIKDAHTHQKVR